MEKQIITAIVSDETMTLSYVEVCQKFQIGEDALLEMIEHGLFHRTVAEPKEMSFDRNAIVRIQSVYRLQSDLGINIPGAVLALELLDELEAVRKELAILRRFAYTEDIKII